MTSIPNVPATLNLTRVPASHPVFERYVGRDWVDRSKVHRAVMDLFPEDLPGPAFERRAVSSILFRVEDAAILIQGLRPLQRNDYGIQTTSLSGLLAALRQARRIGFRVDLNAVSSTRFGERKRKPIPIREIPTWTANRLTQGLTQVSCAVDDLSVLHAKGAPLRVARISGAAEIESPEGLRHLITYGVGRGKAYGCGLLQVFPQ